MPPRQRLWASKSRACTRSGGSRAWATARRSFRCGVVYHLRGWTSCIHGDERRSVPVLNAIDTPPTARLQVSASSLYDHVPPGEHISLYVNKIGVFSCTEPLGKPAVHFGRHCHERSRPMLRRHQGRDLRPGAPWGRLKEPGAVSWGDEGSSRPLAGNDHTAVRGGIVAEVLRL